MKEGDFVENDYSFWNTYLNETIKRIEALILNKEKIYTDFHIHSDYSADGKQNLDQIIFRAQSLGLDIISITDHDAIGIYNDLYRYMKDNEKVIPIIVPGIEFTVENKEYGSQCHILQLMINPKDNDLIENVKHNEEALWRRIDIQFNRISENATLQFFIKKYNIKCSKEDYVNYLKKFKRPIPEYSTLMEYLMHSLSESNVTTWDIFYRLLSDNVQDECDERKQMKADRYKILEERYKNDHNACNSTRFLHSMLAVKGVDDDYFQQYKSCGSLSVNNYNQLKLEQLNKKYITIFAHPSEEKLANIDSIMRLSNNISGMELNRQTNYKDLQQFYNKLYELNMIKVIGSDSHTPDSSWYDDMNFYIADKKDLVKFLKKTKGYIKQT